MEKIHRAARLAEEAAAGGGGEATAEAPAADSLADRPSEPTASEPTTSEPAAAEAPAPVKRARRRAVRPAGPAAPSA